MAVADGRRYHPQRGDGVQLFSLLCNFNIRPMLSISAWLLPATRVYLQRRRSSHTLFFWFCYLPQCFVRSLVLWYCSANSLMSGSGIPLPSLPSLPRPRSLDHPLLQNVTQYHLNRHLPPNQVVETPFPFSITFARNGAVVCAIRLFEESGNAGDT